MTNLAAVGVDVVMVELIKNALNAAALEMQATLERTAYSQIIREVGDVSHSIFDADGRLVAQAVALPIQLAGSSVAVKEIIRAFPPAEMEAGDVYILNDPFHGGSHAPDLILTRPYYLGGKLAGFGCSYAHHQDVGGTAPGSIPPLSTEIYQEGILVPPLQLACRGVINETLVKMILANVRQGEILMGDLRAQLAALEVGQERLSDIAQRFGQDVIEAAESELLARTETAFRKAISAIPSGVYSYEDYLDDDGFALGKPIPIQATLRVDGDTIEVDFSGTSPQCKGSLNCPVASSVSAVYATLKVIVDPEDVIPNNEGIYQAIAIKLPAGSLLNPHPPASVSSRVETQARIGNVIMCALADAIPDRVMAQDSGQFAVALFSGFMPDTGKRFVKSEVVVGGWGGRERGNGPDATDSIVSNLSNTPIEAMEMDLPLRVERYELLPDSAGAGRFRGGLGIRRDVKALVAMDLAVRGERQELAPHGLFGGKDSVPGRWTLVRKSGEKRRLLCKQANIELEAGDVLSITTPGGAGYGPPAKRDARQLAEDLRDGKVTLEAARQDYSGLVDEALAVSA